MFKQLAIALGLFATASAAVEKLTEESFKQKLHDLLRKEGAVDFDETITEGAAKEIFDRFSTQGERRAMLNSDGSWSDSDKQTVLDMHNDRRNTLCAGGTKDDGTDGYYPSSSNMNQLLWDDAIASVAQAYANGCVWGHNGNRNTDFYSYTSSASFDYPSSGIYMGENLAAMWTSSSTVQDSYLTERIENLWEGEMELWHYQSYSSSTINGAGHFTQMAWADTRYLGCGWSQCDDGGYNMYYLVCNYYPGGNYGGQYPYTSGSVCSDCDADRTDNCGSDYSSMCGGCMDPGFTTTGSTSDSSECCDNLDRNAEDLSSSCSTSGGGSEPASQNTPSPVSAPSPTEGSSGVTYPYCDGYCATWQGTIQLQSDSTVLCSSSTIIDCVYEGIFWGLSSESYSASITCNSYYDVEIPFDVDFSTYAYYSQYESYWTDSNGNEQIEDKSVANCGISDLVATVLSSDLTVCELCASDINTSPASGYRIDLLSMALVGIVTLVKLF